MGSATSAMLQFIFQVKLGVLTRGRRSVVFANPNVQPAGSAYAPHHAPRRRPAFTKAMTSPTKPNQEIKRRRGPAGLMSNNNERALCQKITDDVRIA